MAVLVGVYLLDGESMEVDQDGQPSWIGCWTLLRSASCDRDHWEPLTNGRVAQHFATREEARDAGLNEGAAFARMLQADDWLEPMVYQGKTATETNASDRCSMGLIANTSAL
jgi:hypothetical protein